MYSSEEKKVRLRLYYIFLMEDGACTPSELSRFQTICKTMGLNSVQVDNIIRDCKNFLVSCRIPRADRRLIDEIMYRFVGQVNTNRRAQAEILWDLVSLTNLNAKHSTSAFFHLDLSFLVEYWQFDPAVFAAFQDTVETISAITNQMESLKTVNKPYRSIVSRLDQLNNKINQLNQNIKLLVEEIDIA